MVIEDVRRIFVMLGTVKYEIKELYRDSTVYGFWKDDKEISFDINKYSNDFFC